MPSKSDDYLKKGELGEKDLHTWLDKSGLSYLCLSQSPKTYARLFRGQIKRPDFLILLNSIGLIAVDVKNKTPLDGGDYSLEWEGELTHVLAFERLFRIPVWYAYRVAEKDRVVWYWISALAAVEKGTPCRNSKDQTVFLAIKPKDFVRIDSHDDFGKLYAHHLGDLSRLTVLQPPTPKPRHPR
jgi:hypothetical protein